MIPTQSNWNLEDRLKCHLFFTFFIHIKHSHASTAARSGTVEVAPQQIPSGKIRRREFSAGTVQLDSLLRSETNCGVVKFFDLLELRSRWTYWSSPEVTVEHEVLWRLELFGCRFRVVPPICKQCSCGRLAREEICSFGRTLRIEIIFDGPRERKDSVRELKPSSLKYLTALVRSFERMAESIFCELNFFWLFVALLSKLSFVDLQRISASDLVDSNNDVVTPTHIGQQKRFDP